MNRKKLAIVTLFYGLVVGNNVTINRFNESAVYAQENTEALATNIISFKYYESNGSNYSGEIWIEGKPNETIRFDENPDMSSIITNYETVDKYGKPVNEIIIDGEMFYKHEVYLKPKTFDYEIEFIDKNSGQIVKADKPQFVTGKVGSQVKLQRDIVPAGYEFATDGSGINLSSIEETLPRKPANLQIQIQKKMPRNYITFIDDYGNKVGSKVVLGEIGSVVELEDGDRFKIKGDKTVTMKPDKTKINVPVVNTKVWKIVRYVTSEGIHVSGVGGAMDLDVGSYIMQSLDSVPDNYSLVNENEKYIILDNNNLYIDVLIKGDTVSNTINVVDEKGKILEKIDSTGEFGKKIEIPADKIPGYKIFDESLRYTENGSTQKILAKKIIENSISFIDGNANIIGKSQVIRGIKGQKFNITPPNGYYYPDNVNDFIYISSEKLNQIMLVAKIKNNSSNSSSSTNNSGSSTTTPGSGNTNNITPPTTGDKDESEFKTVVSTHSNMSQIPLFDSNGKKSNRSLSIASDWQVDRKKTIKGETYYRVSTNEWVKAEHVFEYTSINQVVTTKNKLSTLYDSRGKQPGSRNLAGNTSWQTDKSTMINGQKFYRVSTTEWLSAADIK